MFVTQIFQNFEDQKKKMNQLFFSTTRELFPHGILQ